jgi:hypothetical protein
MSRWAALARLSCTLFGLVHAKACFDFRAIITHNAICFAFVPKHLDFPYGFSAGLFFADQLTDKFTRMAVITGLNFFSTKLFSFSGNDMFIVAMVVFFSWNLPSMAKFARFKPWPLTHQSFPK